MEQREINEHVEHLETRKARLEYLFTRITDFYAMLGCDLQLTRVERELEVARYLASR